MSIKLDSLSRRLSILEVRFDERLDVPPTQDQPRRTDGAKEIRRMRRFLSLRRGVSRWRGIADVATG